MPTNDFLTIANDPSANVETQVAYAADAERTLFFADGAIPDANQHGKMFRQSSVIASQLAQMICDYSGLDMLDDGNLATLLATMKTQFRVCLQANKTFYVATTGNDANPGSSGSPWLTLQHAANVLQSRYDFNGFQATIQIADGTYAGGANFFGAVPGQNSPIIINGHAGSSASVKIENVITTQFGAFVQLQNFQSGGGAGLNCISAGDFGRADIGAGMIFDTVSDAQLIANSGIINILNDYTIIGAGSAHLQLQNGGIVGIVANVVCTITGAPAITYFVYDFGGQLILSLPIITFVGAPSAGTQKYVATMNGIIYVNGSGVNVFPGTVAGVTTLGGQYA